jgi:hypothetical protein
MKDIEVVRDGQSTINVAHLLADHRCRFVIDGERIKLDHVEWAGGRAPLDVESVLEEMWAHASYEAKGARS